MLKHIYLCLVISFFFLSVYIFWNQKKTKNTAIKSQPSNLASQANIFELKSYRYLKDKLVFFAQANNAFFLLPNVATLENDVLFWKINPNNNELEKISCGKALGFFEGNRLTEIIHSSELQSMKFYKNVKMFVKNSQITTEEATYDLKTQKIFSSSSAHVKSQKGDFYGGSFELNLKDQKLNIQGPFSGTFHYAP